MIYANQLKLNQQATILPYSLEELAKKYPQIESHLLQKIVERLIMMGFRSNQVIDVLKASNISGAIALRVDNSCFALRPFEAGCIAVSICVN